MGAVSKTGKISTKVSNFNLLPYKSKYQLATDTGSVPYNVLNGNNLKDKLLSMVEMEGTHLSPIPLGPTLNRTVRDNIDAANDSVLQIVGKNDGGGEQTKDNNNRKFTYKNNPLDNPKAAKDIVENPNAVYGFSPNPGSIRIGKFANKIDWTDPYQVEVARQTRQAYHDANDAMLKELYNKGYTTKEIASKMVEERNSNRLNSYIKNGDFEGLEIAKKSNIETYGNESGMTIEQAMEKYGSYENIINATVRSNAGMDAVTGLYDIYHGGN